MKRKSDCVLRIPTVVLPLLVFPSLVNAQFPPPKPLPPHKNVTSAAALLPTPSAASPWQLLNNQPPVLDYANCGPGTPLLLTDGTVMLADKGCQDWWKLTPDQFGSYVNGSWTQLASLPAGYSPLYHGSAVLPDGRVIIEGGEYNFLQAVWTNMGAIYDPSKNTWTMVKPPAGWSTIGDAQSVVLSDGTYMQANCCTTQSALLNPATLTWAPTGANKFDVYDEEGWTLLPNGKVLTVDAYVPIGITYMPRGTNSEIYDPATGSWSSAGSTVLQLWDSAHGCGGQRHASFEVGPGVLRPDGTVFYTGANSCGAGHTAIYESNSGTWTAGPDFPGTLDIADGPAALEPNGMVLMMTSPLIFNTPASFLEWDGTSLTQAPPAPNASNDSSFYGNFLVLPTGQILFTDFFFVSLYNPVGIYNLAWAPVIRSAPSVIRPGGSYVISGYRFNGMSQASAYGDDFQSATNYPLVRITNNRTGHVFYSRTHDHSSMAVASTSLVSTHFDVPRPQEHGASRLEVVVNGIPSASTEVMVE
ncbi:MAG: hypothetical protein E6K43_05300 [Gammaproteobacteria bacterium]|nr:MAG: hypothetical protein E6K43_05300 [Gammaproteobacteria bacterium]